MKSPKSLSKNGISSCDYVDSWRGVRTKIKRLKNQAKMTFGFDFYNRF